MMTNKKLPNATAIYLLSLFSYFIICFGGIGLLPAIIAFILAKKSEKLGNLKPTEYDNFGKIKKGKIMAVIGIILNLIIVGIAIWTLVTIGWDAWSDEFIRKWNQGLENGSY
jgi:hypothetical protein